MVPYRSGAMLAIGVQPEAVRLKTGDAKCPGATTSRQAVNARIVTPAAMTRFMEPLVGRKTSTTGADLAPPLCSVVSFRGPITEYGIGYVSTGARTLDESSQSLMTTVHPKTAPKCGGGF